MPSVVVSDALCLQRSDDRWTAARRTIEVRNGRIAALHDGPVADLAADEVIDGRGLLAAPGFVDAHSHSPDNLIRGSAPNLPLELWSLSSAAGRERRSPREAYVAAALGAIEMMRTGTTAVLDHVRISPDIDGETLDAVAEAWRDSGLRATIAPIVADRRVVDTMPFEPEDLDGLDLSGYGAVPMLPAAEQIAVAEAFVDRWHGAEAGRIRGAIGPSAPQRCSDELLVAAADLSARLDVVMHCHALETRAQQAMGFKLYGRGTIAHLQGLGVLGPRLGLAHAIWLEDGDLDRLAEARAAVVHNPVSNARLGSGFCRLPEMLARGVRVGLGTDSACCNDGNNMFETAKWAALLHNLVTADPDAWVDPARALALATAGGADVLGLQDVGTLKVGAAADFVLLRLASPAFVPLTDPVRQYVQAENGSSVVEAFVAGRRILRDGRSTGFDETSLWEEAQDLAMRRLSDNAGVYRAAALLEAPIRRMHARLGRHGGCCA